VEAAGVVAATTPSIRRALDTSLKAAGTGVGWEGRAGEDVEAVVAPTPRPSIVILELFWPRCHENTQLRSTILATWEHRSWHDDTHPFISQIRKADVYSYFGGIDVFK